MATWVTSEELAQDVEGQTVATVFLTTVERHRDRVALRWATTTGPGASGPTATTPSRWRGPRPVCGELGVGPGDRVMLMLRNIPEFHVLDLAV